MESLPVNIPCESGYLRVAFFFRDPSQQDIRDFMDEDERLHWDSQQGAPEERGRFWERLEDLWRSIPDPSEEELRKLMRPEDWQVCQEAPRNREDIFTFYRRKWKRDRKAEALARREQKETQEQEPPPSEPPKKSEMDVPKPDQWLPVTPELAELVTKQADRSNKIEEASGSFDGTFKDVSAMPGDVAAGEFRDIQISPEDDLRQPHDIKQELDDSIGIRDNFESPVSKKKKGELAAEPASLSKSFEKETSTPSSNWLRVFGGILLGLVALVLCFGSAYQNAGIANVMIAHALIAIGWIGFMVSMAVADYFMPLPKRQKYRLLIVVGILSLFFAVVADWFMVHLKSQQLENVQSAPSGVSFVFVKPGLWLNDDTWTFSLEHRGPEPVYNLELVFIDKDSKQDIVVKQPEIDPGNLGLAKYFRWTPSSPDHEHYEVSITSRSGNLLQNLRVERMANQWAYATRVTDLRTKRILLECRDAIFPVDNEFGPQLPVCFPDFAAKD